MDNEACRKRLLERFKEQVTLRLAGVSETMVNPDELEITPRRLVRLANAAEDSRHLTTRLALKGLNMLDRFAPEQQVALVTPKIEFERNQADCEDGDVDACYELGDNFRDGFGTDADPDAALRAYEKACEGNLSDGCFEAGLLYRLRKSDIDEETPLELLKKAAMLETEKCDALPTKTLKYRTRDDCLQAAYYLLTLGNVILADQRDIAGALEYLGKACNMFQPDACSNAAWFLATSNDDAIVDADKALQFALRANEIIPESANFLDTLAAAYARNDRFEEATKAQRDAIKALPTDDPMLAEFEARLALYESEKPYIETD